MVAFLRDALRDTWWGYIFEASPPGPPEPWPVALGVSSTRALVHGPVSLYYEAVKSPRSLRRIELGAQGHAWCAGGDLGLMLKRWTHSPGYSFLGLVSWLAISADKTKTACHKHLGQWPLMSAKRHLSVDKAALPCHHAVAHDTEKDTGLEAAEVACTLVKHLLCRHEDLSLDFEYPYKSQTWYCAPVGSTLGRHR